MIKSFSHRGLKQIFETGNSNRIDVRFRARCLEILTALNGATHTNQLNVPGYVLHPLHQFRPLRWSIRVTAQWRITFEFNNGDAYRVDFEQYH